MIIEILTAILVVTTVIYVYLTYQIWVSNKDTVDIMREQSEAISRPHVTIEPYVRTNTPVLYIKIINTGQTSAKNLTLTLSKDFHQFGNSERNLRNFPAFNSTIDSFAPNQQFLFGLAQSFVIFGKPNDNLPKQFSITAKYNIGTREVEETSNIDLRAYEWSEEYKDPVVEQLKGIKKQLENLK